MFKISSFCTTFCTTIEHESILKNNQYLHFDIATILATKLFKKIAEIKKEESRNHTIRDL